MNITDVKVFPVEEEKLKAYATITFDNCFIVRDLKVISGNKGFFIAMPSKKRKDGTFRDVAHPLNSETRKMIEEAVLKVYEQEAEIVVEPAGPEVDAAPDSPPEVDAAPDSPPEVDATPDSLPDVDANVPEDTAEKIIPSDTETSDPTPVENTEPEKQPTDNPTIEPSDDPEKAFSYEE